MRDPHVRRSRRVRAPARAQRSEHGRAVRRLTSMGEQAARTGRTATLINGGASIGPHGDAHQRGSIHRAVRIRTTLGSRHVADKLVTEARLRHDVSSVC
jgi:hypothetical protein